MNIKQFLVAKACHKLPSDICSIIWSYIETNAVDSIRNIYFLKVKRNLDFFLILSKINNSCNFNYVNKIVDHYKNKITFSYIQEHNIWLNYLYDIIYYKNGDSFYISNVETIIDGVIRADTEIYLYNTSLKI